MAISLEKSQTISLSKQDGSALRKVTMGLGWDPVKTKGLFGSIFGGGAASIDLDASCILLDGQKQPVDTVWFGQLKSQDGSIKHSGDNRTGDGDGDDESIYVDLNALPARVQYLVFTVNSFRGQTFEKIESANCRILDAEAGSVLATFDLTEQGGHTGLVMAYMQRTNAGWTVTAVGSKTNGATVQDVTREAIAAIR